MSTYPTTDSKNPDFDSPSDDIANGGHTAHQAQDLTHSQICLIIPAYNEAENMPQLFQRLADLYSSLPEDPYFRLLVVLVDNASTDGTAELAIQQYQQLKQTRPRLFEFTVVTELKRGYGAACLRGIEEAGHHFDMNQAATCFAFYDADMADDHMQLPALWETILSGEADMMIASRARLAEPGSLSPTQRFGNWLSCLLIRLITGHQYGDLGPMRVISQSALKQMHMQDLTWGWTVEMQFKAARLGLSSGEIDTSYQCRRMGKSKISGSLIGSAKAGYKILYTIARLSMTFKPANPK